jgi:phosphoribosylglycinamide formyltransferase 1
MIRIAVFASGSGTNAENIVRYFSGNDILKIQLILTNNPKAGVIERASKLKVPVEIFSKADLESSDLISNKLKEAQIDFIVLAGFLLLIPKKIIDSYKGRIINIHPALLPLNGGKGFYGHNVHQAVISSGAIMSGITIHHVNEKFDEGEIIFQAACHVSKEDTADSLAVKIHKLEYSYFPVVIEKVIRTIFYNKPETT